MILDYYSSILHMNLPAWQNPVASIPAKRKTNRNGVTLCHFVTRKIIVELSISFFDFINCYYIDFKILKQLY